MGGRTAGAREGGREAAMQQEQRSGQTPSPSRPRLLARSRLSLRQPAGHPEPRLGTTGASLSGPDGPKAPPAPEADGAPLPSAVPSHSHGVRITPPRQRGKRMMPLASLPRNASRPGWKKDRGSASLSSLSKSPSPRPWLPEAHAPLPRKRRGNARFRGAAFFFSPGMGYLRRCTAKATALETDRQPPNIQATSGLRRAVYHCALLRSSFQCTEFVCLV